MGGQISHFGRVGATRVEHGTAVPVDCTRVLTSKLNDVTHAAGRVIDVEMRKRFPAATETKDFDVVLAAAIHGTLDDGIESRDITATGKNTDTLYSHDLPLKGVNRGREPSKLEARLSHQHVRFGSKADIYSAKT